MLETLAQEILYGGQFTSSFHWIKPNYVLVTVWPDNMDITAFMKFISS